MDSATAVFNSGSMQPYSSYSGSDNDTASNSNRAEEGRRWEAAAKAESNYRNMLHRQGAEKEKRYKNATPETDPETWCKRQSNTYYPSTKFWANPRPDDLIHLSKKPFLCPKEIREQGGVSNNNTFKVPRGAAVDAANDDQPDGEKKTLRGLIDYRINHENRKDLIPYKQRLLELGLKPKTRYNPFGKPSLAKKDNADYVRWDRWGEEIQDPRPKAKGGKRSRRKTRRRKIRK